MEGHLGRTSTSRTWPTSRVCRGSTWSAHSARSPAARSCATSARGDFPRPPGRWRAAHRTSCRWPWTPATAPTRRSRGPSATSSGARPSRCAATGSFNPRTRGAHQVGSSHRRLGSTRPATSTTAPCCSPASWSTTGTATCPRSRTSGSASPPWLGYIPQQVPQVAYGVVFNGDDDGTTDYLTAVEVTDFSRRARAALAAAPGRPALRRLGPTPATSPRSSRSGAPSGANGLQAR